MIELDIWLTTDDKLVIMHGGDNGELPSPVNSDEVGPSDSNNGSDEEFVYRKENYIFEHSYS